MPYKKIADLPEWVRKLSPKAQEAYLKAFNAAWETYADDKDREGKAHAVAAKAAKSVVAEALELQIAEVGHRNAKGDNETIKSAIRLLLNLLDDSQDNADIKGEMLGQYFGVKAALEKVRPGAEILEVNLGHHHDQRVYEIEIKGAPNTEDEVFISETGEVVKIENEHHHDH